MHFGFLCYFEDTYFLRRDCLRYHCEFNILYSKRYTKSTFEKNYNFFATRIKREKFFLSILKRLFEVKLNF